MEKFVHSLAPLWPARHGSDDVLHGDDEAHEARRDVLCRSWVVYRKSAAVPPVHSCAGRFCSGIYI